VSWAEYRRGLAYLKLAHRADRDQTATRQAAEAFQRLLGAHPTSEYAEDARKRLGEVRASLASHELYVARYYVRKKKYDAALDRLRGLVATYPDSPAGQEATKLAAEVEALKK
jgi:outer membrane protein assembly factor BamD